MFGSMVGFSGSADRIALFPITSNPIWRQAAILELDNFEWLYLRNGSFDFMFGSRVRFSGSADRMALFPVHALTRCRQRKLRTPKYIKSP